MLETLATCWDVLTLSALDIICKLNEAKALEYAGYANLIIFPLAFLFAAWQDHLHMEVYEWICFSIASLLILYNILFNGSIGLIICIVMIYCTFSNRLVFKNFGQADFLLLTHLFTAYGFRSTSAVFILVACVCWLVSLGFYVLIYRYPDGTKWHLFNKKPIPAIPSYAIACCITALIRVTCWKMVFYAGY